MKEMKILTKEELEEIYGQKWEDLAIPDEAYPVDENGITKEELKFLVEIAKKYQIKINNLKYLETVPSLVSFVLRRDEDYQVYLSTLDYLLRKEVNNEKGNMGKS